MAENEKQPSPQERDVLREEEKAVERLIAIHEITADNTEFEETAGGFLRMRYTDEEGQGHVYDRVAVHRCFPHSDPTHFISIREPETDGKEIGLIEDMGTLPDDMQRMLEEQMSLRYFTPKIRRIHKIREEYGYAYWDVLTDRGECRFTVRMGGSNVYPIGKDRYLVNDLDGNRFEIPDVYALTAREIKQLDLFI